MEKKLPTEVPQGHSTKSGNVTVATTTATDNKDQQASCSSEATKSNNDATKNIHHPKVPVLPVSVTYPPTITQPQKMTIMNHGDSFVNPHFAENNHNNWNIVSPMVHLSKTCEAYQRHVQTFVKMGLDHGGRSKSYQTCTLLDHMVSSWIEKGGCFMNNQGQFFNVGPQLLHFIILNHWNPCMDHCLGEETGEAKIELLQRKNNTFTKVLLHGTTTTNNNDGNVTRNERVVTLGSDSFSDEFLYHIYAYAKVHAKNINSTMARYRNSKRCLKHWCKKGGKVTDGNGFELTHQEALCVMEGILWRHYNEWLNEYIVI